VATAASVGPGSTPAAYLRGLGFLVHHAGALIVVATAARVGPGSTPGRTRINTRNKRKRLKLTFLAFFGYKDT